MLLKRSQLEDNLAWQMSNWPRATVAQENGNECNKICLRSRVLSELAAARRPCHVLTLLCSQITCGPRSYLPTHPAKATGLPTRRCKLQARQPSWSCPHTHRSYTDCTAAVHCLLQVVKLKSTKATVCDAWVRCNKTRCMVTAIISKHRLTLQ